ncbi:MAG: hypothetical protein KDI79_02390 [Anaerolineae bacterium]|nr:hypothetical protein [Anaerolineae bacterium]
MRHVVFVILLGFLISVYTEFIPISRLRPVPLLQSSKFISIFTDNFETETNWLLFEEIVGGNSCYGSGVGRVARSVDVAYESSHSLLVWANQASSTKSNHLIGYKNYPNTHQTDIWRYQVHAYIDPATENSGQTGPEFSLQNTRQIAPDQFRTSTAGIQYIANPFSSDKDNWQVWREAAPGVAGWHTFMEQPITAGEWYTLTLEADFIDNHYVTFSIQGGGLNQLIELSAYNIAAEDKFTEEAFVITLESENLWNNCGVAGAYNYKVYYDQVSLMRPAALLYLPVILSKLK